MFAVYSEASGVSLGAWTTCRSSGALALEPNLEVARQSRRARRDGRATPEVGPSVALGARSRDPRPKLRARSAFFERRVLKPRTAGCPPFFALLCSAPPPGAPKLFA